jgi:bla regulator protein blaR1
MMIPEYLMPLANHLWQSTVFAVAVAVLCFVLRKHRASLRYWLWLAASVKFLIPLSLLIDLASRLGSGAVPVIAPTPISSMVREISQPFALPVPAPFLASVPSVPSHTPTLLFAIWLCGFAASASCWLRAWLRMRSAVRVGVPIETVPGLDSKPMRVVESSLLVEPCVFGIFQPVLLVPEGIGAHLTREQWEAIFLHELCHVRRRDNLTAALHIAAETVFWFYLPIYWMGQRLMSERETACDEEVLRVILKPAAYAQGILAVCRFGVQTAPVCAAGVAGHDLKRRIEAIMERPGVLRLSLGRKLFVAAVLGAVIGGPFWTGMQVVRASQAQSPSAAAIPGFGVASIKVNRTGERNSGFRRFTGGELNTLNITLKMLIAFAYAIPEDRVLQGPGWLDSEKYDILAKPDRGAGQAVDLSMGAIRVRTQALLADRFKLVLHKDTRQLPIFKLLVDKNGPRHLEPPKGTTPDLINNGHHVMCVATSMEYFAKVFLTGQMGGPVIDQTGIQGNFDFSMDWTPDESAPRRQPDAGEPPTAPDPAGPSLLSALREQLGLKLEAGKGPVEVLIIDRAEKPSEN